MDLLACSGCGHRYYAGGVRSREDLACPHCGDSLDLALDHITSIPLDARWLEPRLGMERRETTVVELRRKRRRRGGTSRRIIKVLGDYFDLTSYGRLIKVRVSRGTPESAALRVAAVLDGVDGSWEDHFYLPWSQSNDPYPQPQRSDATPRGHLHLVGSESRTQADGWYG